ncbi:PREDICTED: atherin-like [Elephantulus edwardii]|uniref:atherin-like n=1 Tax=Elephantulus edwardii TaxID=28737 RepID=UPI0003F0F280|nr:PREDICTED: atherin-like [Elephantulus edwardii]
MELRDVEFERNPITDPGVGGGGIATWTSQARTQAGRGGVARREGGAPRAEWSLEPGVEYKGELALQGAPSPGTRRSRRKGLREGRRRAAKEDQPAAPKSPALRGWLLLLLGRASHAPRHLPARQPPPPVAPRNQGPARAGLRRPPAAPTRAEPGGQPRAASDGTAGCVANRCAPEGAASVPPPEPTSNEEPGPAATGNEMPLRRPAVKSPPVQSDPQEVFEAVDLDERRLPKEWLIDSD